MVVVSSGNRVWDAAGVPALPPLLHGPEHRGEHGQQPGQQACQR